MSRKEDKRYLWKIQRPKAALGSDAASFANKNSGSPHREQTNHGDRLVGSSSTRRLRKA